MDDDLVEKLRRLLGSDDDGFRRQGIELLVSIGDPALYDALTEGVRYVVGEDSEWVGGRVGRFDVGEEGPASELDMRSVIAMVATAPPGCRAAALREEVTSLFPYLDYGPMDVSALAMFPNLQELAIHGASAIEPLPGDFALPRLQTLRLDTLRATELPKAFFAMPALEGLFVHYARLVSLDLETLTTLRVLEIGYCPHLETLDGLDALRRLETVTVNPRVPLSTTTLDAMVGLDAFASIGHELRARRRERDGDLAGAVEDLSWLIAREASEERFAKRADLRSRLRDHRGAVDDYTDAIRMAQTEKHRLYHDRAVDQSALGDNDNAERDYREALRIEPNAAFTWRALGCVLGRKRDDDGAVAAFTRALELHPNPVMEDVCFNNRGASHFDAGRIQDAIDDYNRWLAIEPRSAYELENRAEAHLAIGRWDFAIADARRSLALDDQRTEARGHLEVALERERSHAARPSDERYRDAVRSFARAALGERYEHMRSVVSKLDAETLDAWADGVAYLENGVRRCETVYGVLTLRPVDETLPIDAVVDFDRHLISLAPAGTTLARLRSEVRTLLVGAPQVDVRGLVGFDALESLWFETTELCHANCLAALAHLRSLGFGGCDAAAALHGLGGADPLRTLRIRRNKTLLDPRELAGLHTLEVLDLDDGSYIGDLSVLAELRGLQELVVPKSTSLEGLPDELVAKVRTF